MTRPLALLASLAGLLAAVPASAQGRIEPGEWEQRMTVSAPGMPGGPQEQVVRQCITRADAALFGDRERWAREMIDANPEMQCKVERSDTDGSAIAVTLACAHDMRLRVRHDYQGATGTIDAETLVAGESKGRNHIESRKVADTCSAETIARWKAQNPGKEFKP